MTCTRVKCSTSFHFADERPFVFNGVDVKFVQEFSLTLHPRTMRGCVDAPHGRECKPKLS